MAESSFENGLGEAEGCAGLRIIAVFAAAIAGADDAAVSAELVFRFRAGATEAATVGETGKHCEGIGTGLVAFAAGFVSAFLVESSVEDATWLYSLNDRTLPDKACNLALTTSKSRWAFFFVAGGCLPGVAIPVFPNLCNCDLPFALVAMGDSACAIKCSNVLESGDPGKA